MAEQKIHKQKEMQYLTSELEAVRKLPDVYIGALGNRGLMNMYREIIQNSLDEIIKGNTLDMNIIVSVDTRNYIHYRRFWSGYQFRRPRESILSITFIN